MAAVKKDFPTKSFFSSPSHTLKKLVNALPKAQNYLSSQEQPKCNLRKHHQQQQHAQPRLSVGCMSEEDYNVDNYEDDAAKLDADDGFRGGIMHVPSGIAAQEDGVNLDRAVDDDTDYSGSSEGEYPRPRIHQDLLPHDFSEWQKSPSIAPYPHSEASSTSREAESFSEVLSSSTSQDYCAPRGKCSTQRQQHCTNGRVEHNRSCSQLEPGGMASHDEPQRYPSSSLCSAMVLSPAADLHLHKVRQNLPDLKLNNGMSGACRYGGPAGLKGLHDGCLNKVVGAPEDGRRNSVDGSCWQRTKMTESVIRGGGAREIVDIVPLIESYRVHQEDGHQRGNFQHRASMVYTRAPSREALAKKVSDSTNSRRVSRNTRKLKMGDAAWEEQENVPRRAYANDVSLSPRRARYEHSVDIAKLQSQVEELQRKLVIREGIQQSNRGAKESKDESSEVFMERLEELQRKVAERDQMLRSAKEDIAHKEEEIQVLKRCLQDSEATCRDVRSRNASTEDEVRALRCEVAALRWQIAIDAEKTRSEIETSVRVKDIHECTSVQKLDEEMDICQVEEVRRMYVAALIVTRHVPIEECLALVGALRAQLQRSLRLSTSSCML